MGRACRRKGRGGPVLGTSTVEIRTYVAGLTPRSQEAIRTVTALCNEHLAGRYLEQREPAPVDREFAEM